MTAIRVESTDLFNHEFWEAVNAEAMQLVHRYGLSKDVAFTMIIQAGTADVLADIRNVLTEHQIALIHVTNDDAPGAEDDDGADAWKRGG